jgi:Adenylate kinase and related kinases
MKLHLLGPSGSGVSTLGTGLANALDIDYFDTDDFFWVPTDPPFTTVRARAERAQLLGDALEGRDSWVLGGSALGWGDFIRPELDLVIYKYLEPGERLRRIMARERRRYGARVDEGGDMRASHLKFVEWAMGYESGGMDMRSVASEEAWLAGLSCPVLRVEGNGSFRGELEFALARIGSLESRIL